MRRYFKTIKDKKENIPGSDSMVHQDMIVYPITAKELPETINIRTLPSLSFEFPNR